MVERATVTGTLGTAERLVELLERDNFPLDLAVWTKDEEGESRLYLVPRNRELSKLKQSIQVAEVISKHKDELPDRHDLRYSIVTSDHPVIRAVRSARTVGGKVEGLYREGTYIDTAYVFRPAA
jgi:hypothetical protein